MKIYLATTAPGTEQVQPDGFVKVPYRCKLIGKWNRLYSYHYIIDSKRVEQSFIDITQINKK